MLSTSGNSRQNLATSSDDVVETRGLELSDNQHICPTKSALKLSFLARILALDDAQKIRKQRRVLYLLGLKSLAGRQLDNMRSASPFTPDLSSDGIPLQCRQFLNVQFDISTID